MILKFENGSQCGGWRAIDRVATYEVFTTPATMDSISSREELHQLFNSLKGTRAVSMAEERSKAHCRKCGRPLAGGELVHADKLADHTDVELLSCFECSCHQELGVLRSAESVLSLSHVRAPHVRTPLDLLPSEVRPYFIETMPEFYTVGPDVINTANGASKKQQVVTHYVRYRLREEHRDTWHTLILVGLPLFIISEDNGQTLDHYKPMQ